MTWTSFPTGATTLILSLPPGEPYAPPLWLATAMEHLRMARQDVHPLDLNRRLFGEADAQTRRAWDPGCPPAEVMDLFSQGSLAQGLSLLVEAVANSEVKVVGLSLPPQDIGPSVHLIRALRQAAPDLCIIARGVAVETQSGQQALTDAGTDYFIIGEGEVTFGALLDPLLAGEEVGPTPGVIPAPRRPDFPFKAACATPLEALPMPTFSDFDLDDYAPFSHGRYLPFVTSRGCLGGCAFCTDRPGQGPHRFYPPDELVEHLSRLARDHHLDRIDFRDLAINCRPEQLLSWCDGLAAKKLDLVWVAEGTLQPGTTREVLDAMRRAGCIALRLGLDSASTPLLKSMGKPFDAATASQVLMDARDAGLYISVSLMVGFPGETTRDMRLTTDFMVKHASCISHVDLLATCELRTGCRLTERPEEYGVRPGEGVFHSGYVDQGGVTREVRNQRAQELLEVLTNLGIPVFQVLDDYARAGEPNPNLERHREALRVNSRELNTMEAGPLQALMTPLDREVTLSIEDTPLTRPPGLFAGVRLDGRDLDLTYGRWRTWRGEDETLHLEAALLFVPGRLNLHISNPPGHGLILQLSLLLEKPARLEQVRVGLFASPLLKRYLGTTGWGDLALPPPPARDLVLCPAPTEYLLVAEGEQARHEDKPLTALSIHPTDEHAWQAVLSHERRGPVVLLQRSIGRGKGEEGEELLEAGTHALHTGRLDWVTVEAMERAARSGTLQAGESEVPDFCLLNCSPGDVKMPPLLLAQLCGALRGVGFKGPAIDLNALLHQNLAPELRQRLWSQAYLDAWLDPDRFEAEVWPPMGEEVWKHLTELVDRLPHTLILLAEDAGVPMALKLCHLARGYREDLRTVICGPGIYWTSEGDQGLAPHMTLHPETATPLPYLEDVDVFLRGEVEQTLPQLLRYLAADGNLMEIPGALLWRSKRWINTGDPIPVAELDLLPLPDFSDLDLSLYASRTLPMEASRGCQRNCVTCSRCSRSRPHRVRDAWRVVEEVEFQMGRVGPEALEFTDLALNGDAKHLHLLCHGLMERGISLPWRARLMVSPEVTGELLSLMVKAGCYEIQLGVDSLCEHVLQAMRKGFSLVQLEELLIRIRDAGLDSGLSLMVGFPRETPELFDDTVNNLARLSSTITRVDQVVTCELTNGTRLWDDPAIFGIDATAPRYWESWVGPFGNTAEERQRRKEELLSRAASLNLIDPS